APGAASQQTPAPSEPAPAPARDTPVAAATPPALLAASCANCHGYEGRGAWPITSIAGRPYQELYQQLDAWRRGEAIDDATVMPRLMAGYSEADVETLARWFAALPANAQ
ncbi:MAG: hypothetical protein JJU27_18785, partial [Gammaproteobacteria bacterium]|nr:hypothetical protein [Gammaproteobacteria bacterium]